ncbi:MAG: DNA polymerase IV, partial [Thiohalocapsa sp.]
YARVSGQIMSALESISPIIEKVSIDEAYLDVSGLERLLGAPRVIAERTKAAIQQAVGLTASVGIGPNRLIAKLASDFRKPDAITVVNTNQIGAFLDPMPLAVLRGVGVKTAPRLERLGLQTVGDLRRLPLEDLRRYLGARAGTQLHLQSRGIADDGVYPATERKSISKETTFAEDVTDPMVLRDTLRWAAQEVGYLARHEGHAGSVVTLKIRLRPFETHTRSRSLRAPTMDDLEIFHSAWALFKREAWTGKPVRLIGLGLSGWQQAPAQQDLFGADDQPRPRPRQDRLHETLDAVRSKFGSGYIQRGSLRKK